MNKEERHTMSGIVAVTKYLVDIWRGSKCPDTHEYLFECKKCKYNELCAKLDELSEVVKMILYNAWHLLSRFNNLYAVSTKDNVARLISQKNINYYGRKTVTFMCIKDGALHCYY